MEQETVQFLSQVMAPADLPVKKKEDPRIRVYQKKEPKWRDGGGGLVNFCVHENYEDMRRTRIEFDEKIDRVIIDKDDGETNVYFDTVPGTFYINFEYGATLDGISEDRFSFWVKHLCH